MNDKKKKLLEIYIKTSKPEELFFDTLEKLNEIEQKIQRIAKENQPKTDVELEALIKSFIPKPLKSKDGHTPTKGEIIDLIKPMIPDPLNGSPDTAIDIKEKLKSLKGEDRLSIFDLKDTEWLKGKNNMNWSSAGFKVYHDGTLTGDGSFGSPLSVIGGGAGNPALPFNSIQYNNAGVFGGDADATRDAITHDTTIAKINLGFVNQILVKDISGFGNDGAGVNRFDNGITQASSAWAVADGAVFGSADLAIIIGNFTDATGNIVGQITGDSTGLSFVHDDITALTASVNLRGTAGGQAVLSLNDANSANTFDRKFFVDPTNIGWKDNLVGYQFNLPQVIGAAGTVMTDVLGNGVLSMQPSGGVTSFNTLTGAVTISAGAGITLTPVGNDISIASTGGTGVTFGAIANGFTPTWVQYIDLAGNQYGDALFTRNSTTNETNISMVSGTITNSTHTGQAGLIQGAYQFRTDTAGANAKAVVGAVDASNIDPTFSNVGAAALYITSTRQAGLLAGNLATELVFGNVPATKGSIIAQTLTDTNLVVSDTPGKLFAQMGADLVTGRIGISYVNGNTNTAGDIGVIDTVGVRMHYEYNDTANLSNSWTLFTTGGVFKSDRVAANKNYFQLAINPGVSTYGLGDLSNADTGLVAIVLDEAAKLTASGDIFGTQLGIVFVTDNTNNFAGFGDTFNVTNGTSIVIDNATQKISGNTNTNDKMFYLDIPATGNTSFGFKALNSLTTGRSNIGIGYFAGNLITASTDNIIIGYGALSNLTGTAGGNTNIVIGNGAMFNSTATTGSGLSNNVVIGENSGINITEGGLGSGAGDNNVILGNASGSVLTTGRDNILVGYQSNVSSATAISRLVFGFSAIGTADYQVMFGGSGSPFSEFVLGGDKTQSGFVGQDVLVRTIKSQGTNIAGGDLNLLPGLATGNAVTGDINLQNAIAGASGTTLQTASTWFRVSPSVVRTGDVGGVGNNTLLTVDDVNRTIILAASSRTLISSDTIDLNGGPKIKRDTVTDATTVLTTQQYLVTGLGLTVNRAWTLPTAGGASLGHMLIIKNKATSGANIILTAAGADTIDNAATYTVIPGNSVTVVADGISDWEII